MEDDLHDKNVIIEGSSSWEAEKKWFQLRIKELESAIEEMKWKRIEDLKGNERVLAIFASKEEAWRMEKKKLLQQLELQHFNDSEDIPNKVESVANPIRKVNNYSRYVAELKRRKDKVEKMLRNSLSETEEWKLKAQEKKHVDAALRSITEEMLRLQKEIEEKDAFILSHMPKKDKAGSRGSVVKAELKAKEKSVSNSKTHLRYYTDGEGSREAREAEKWKRLYLGLKFELDNLQIYKANPLPDNVDHTGGEIRRSSTVNRGRRLKANLDRKHSEEIECFKLERKAKDKQTEGLRKQLITKKKTLLGEKEIKSDRRSLSMC